MHVSRERLTEAEVGVLSHVSSVLRFLFAEGVTPFIFLKVAALLLTALRGSEGLGRGGLGEGGWGGGGGGGGAQHSHSMYMVKPL